MRFRKVYLEISNICNLSCRFCPGTKRSKNALTEEELAVLLPKIRPYTDYLYFHLMGEPLLHPKLERFLKMAGEYGFKVILTTNGTLLKKQQEMLLRSPALHKINISLHAFEANDLAVPFETYLSDCFAFGNASAGKKLVVYRLWNQGGEDAQNVQILDTMRKYFPGNWVKERLGTRIADRTYLEYGDKFDWPDIESTDTNEKIFCYGLRDQIGILADGTVVPCCLDNNGEINLGNIFEKELDEIINSERAQKIYNGFSNRTAREELCKRCSFVRKF